ncbi:hypothetical protein ACI784_09255 [Geodermatophilus sp. SYSU D01186]
MTKTSATGAPPLRCRRLLVAASAVLALAVCAVTLWAGGATDVVPPPRHGAGQLGQLGDLVGSTRS